MRSLEIWSLKATSTVKLAHLMLVRLVIFRVAA